MYPSSKKVREKSRERHNHKPQPFPNTKRKRKTKPNKRKSNKRTKSTKISSLSHKRVNRNAQRTEKHKNKITLANFLYVWATCENESLVFWASGRLSVRVVLSLFTLLVAKNTTFFKLTAKTPTRLWLVLVPLGAHVRILYIFLIAAHM